MEPVVIRVSAPKTTQVQPQPVRHIAITPTDGARVVVVATRGPVGPPGESGETSVINEIPGGTKDGVNTVFTLAQTPAAGSVAVWRNGLREMLGVGYAVTGATVTFTTPPLASDDLTADYLMEG